MIMNKSDNSIFETFVKLTSKTYPYGTEDALMNEMIKDELFPKDIDRDEYGNYFYNIGQSKTIFASHLDTACKEQKSVQHVFDGNFIKTDGKTILGADDKAGVTILLHLIKNNVPGLYYFFIGEEVGCIGSGMVAKYGKSINQYDRIISFDRKDTNSIITFQSSIRCCSDVFADSLANQLNNFGFKYTKDQGGVYTDSAEFVDIIPECTNISVGYYKEHTFGESQDIQHLISLAEACVNIDWESLPVNRDVSKPEYKSYGSNNWSRSSYNWRDYDYGRDFHSRDYSKFDTEDWYGQNEYGEYKKNRRKNKRGKTYFDHGGDLIQIDDFKSNSYSTNSYITNSQQYDAIIDRILDNKLTSDELEAVKDQYLDMDEDNDKQFYQYLLDNIV